MINKTFLVALLGIASICRVSFGADDLTKTNAANHSSVEVKCQILTVPLKVLEDTGNARIGLPTGICSPVGVFQKDQMDVLWKACKNRAGVLVEDIGDIIVRSGKSGEIQNGYNFSYPVDYDASARPTKLGTLFLGTKLEVTPVVSDATTDLSLKFEVTQLKEITQVYAVKESDLMKKPSLADLVSALPKNTVFNPVFFSRTIDGSVTLFTDQSVFYSMDDYENSELMGKIPLQKIKLKDPSKRRFLIITAKVIEPQASKH